MHEATLAAFSDEMQKISGHQKWVTKILEAGKASKGDVLALADKLKGQGYPASQVNSLRTAIREAKPGQLRGLT